MLTMGKLLTGAAVLIAMFAIATCSPFGGGAFTCTDDSQCFAAGVQGVCQMPAGACSFPDGNCPSGQRYGDLSGTLAGVCVGDEPPDASIVDADLPDTDPGAPDAPPIDANVCFGSGLLVVCMTNPLTGTVNLETAGQINTDSSPSCSADVTSPSGLCVIAGDTINVTAAISATGSRPLVLVANTITIAGGGSLDVASHRGGQVGASANSVLCDPGTAPGTSRGGYGGSFGGQGGNGGSGSGGGGGGTAGATQTATVVRGGCAGSGGGGGNPGVLGNGGGAVYLIATTSITVDGTINASGGGATGGNNGDSGGGGGGSGGMIGLDAPTIGGGGGGRIVANGGSGGEGSGDSTGGNDGNDPNPATPGTAPAGGGGASTGGGNGGGGSTGTPGNGGTGNNGLDGGGGAGGGVGVIRTFGTFTFGGQISPPPT
jgi:hypothetical protein